MATEIMALARPGLRSIGKLLAQRFALTNRLLTERSAGTTAVTIVTVNKNINKHGNR